jgi:hypothetical protein
MRAHPGMTGVHTPIQKLEFQDNIYIYFFRFQKFHSLVTLAIINFRKFITQEFVHLLISLLK